MWGFILLLSQCQYIPGPMAFLVCASSQWKKKIYFSYFLQDACFKSRFFKDLGIWDIQGTVSQLRQALQIAFLQKKTSLCGYGGFLCCSDVCDAYSETDNQIMESVEWSWMLQSSGLLSSVSYPKNGQTNQNAMKMDGAKAVAPVFYLLDNLEKSQSEHLFKSAAACTCISPQARCITNSAFAILKALVATKQMYWRAYAKKGLNLVWEPPLLFYFSLSIVITVLLRSDRQAAPKGNVSNKPIKKHDGSIRLAVTATGCGTGDFLERAWILARPVPWYTSLELASNCL